jgi:hypothetical protein
MPHDLRGALHQLIGNRQNELGLADGELSKMLGYESLTPLRLIKSARMRLPIAKVASLALALELPADELLELHLSECAPEVLKALEECVGVLTITPHERRLVHQLRVYSGGLPTSIVPFRTYGLTAAVAVEEAQPEGPLVGQGIATSEGSTSTAKPA